MDKKIEQEFVKNYIDKNYQERLLFELGSAKHRQKALSRFSHDAESILNKTVIKKIITNFNEFHMCDKSVYFISWDESDGKTLPLEDAIKRCTKSYMSVILIGNKFVLIKEEAEKRTPKMLLISLR